MEFFEMKSLAKKAGMKLESTTKKVEVQEWLDDNKQAVINVLAQEEAKVEVEVPEVGASFEISPTPQVAPVQCPHQFVFTNVQAVRQPNTKDNQGNNRRGRLDYKDVYVCSLCKEVVLKNKSERPVEVQA